MTREEAVQLAAQLTVEALQGLLESMTDARDALGRNGEQAWAEVARLRSRLEEAEALLREVAVNLRATADTHDELGWFKAATQEREMIARYEAWLAASGPKEGK